MCEYPLAAFDLGGNPLFPNSCKWVSFPVLWCLLLRILFHKLCHSSQRFILVDEISLHYL